MWLFKKIFGIPVETKVLVNLRQLVSVTSIRDSVVPPLVLNLNLFINKKVHWEGWAE